jgi:hypothetical protein
MFLIGFKVNSYFIRREIEEEAGLEPLFHYLFVVLFVFVDIFNKVG